MYISLVILLYFFPGLIIDSTYGEWKIFLRHLVFATIISIPFSIIVDYTGVSSRLWYVPQSIFGSRFLGSLPYEDFFWMIFAVYLMVALYDRFTDKQFKKISFGSSKLWRFIIPAIIVLGFFFYFAHTAPGLFVWNTSLAYIYLGSLFFLLPAIILFLVTRYPMRPAIMTAACFFCFTLALEILGGIFRCWIFPGTYLLPMLSLGSVSIPLEELLFVGIIGPFAAIGFYECFDTDQSVSRAAF